jgi:hypothetical protein
MSRVDYSMIPAFTLISSILMLLINIIERSYNIIIECKKAPLSVNYEKMQESKNQSDNDAVNSELNLEEQKNIESN